jgi:hypothetical protein
MKSFNGSGSGGGGGSSPFAMTLSWVLLWLQLCMGESLQTIPISTHTPETLTDIACSCGK